MAGLHFDITGDNSNFMRKLNEARYGVRSTSKQIEESGMSIEQMFGRMTKAAAVFGAGFSAQQFASQIMKIRGEFQQLEVAFNTMLGSKEKADTLMSQLVKTAAITPFDLQGVANGAKQLLAYGTAAEDVNGTLVRLGDIAAGLSIPLGDLVYLYGTTMTQGRLFTQDLRQFQGRGIPLADELAKQFGVTKDKVGELVTAGKVGFPEVQKAIEAMTNEGGKFGGLMEAQSKTITGQISNIEDAISTMFNEIGKSNEGIINSTLSGVSYLVEHWEDVAIAIESAAIAYGTYKAAVMTTAALQGAEQTLKIDTELEGLKSLLVVKEQSKNADLEAAVASGTLTEAKAVQLASLREELATRLTVLKLKEEEAVAEQISALSAFNTAKQASEAAYDRLEKMDALYQAALAQGDASYEQYAIEQLQTASANANSAATNLNTAEKNLNTASSKRKAASEAVDTMATQANTVANHANTASMNIMKMAGIQLTTMLKAMWATLMANPLMLVAGAVVGLGFALYKIATAETEAEKATRMYNEALDEQQKKQDEYKERIDSLIKAIDDNNKSGGERLQAFEALKAEYPTVLSNLLTEAEYLREVHKYKKLIAEEDNKRAKQSDEEILEEEERKLRLLQQRIDNFRKQNPGISDDSWRWGGTMDNYNAQLGIVNKQKAKVASHDVTSFLGNIKDMKDSDIVSVIDGINSSLKALGKSGDDAIAIVTELGGEFSKSQLSSIKNALETEQNARNTEKNTGKGWIEKYKKSYLDAKEELDKFLNSESELSEVEYERKLKELTDKKDEAEKKYKASGGKVVTDKQSQSEAEKLRKQQQKSAEELLSLRRKNQQDEINLMKDGTDKRLKQIELDYQKEIDAIRKKEQEWGKANGGKLTEEQSVQISLSYSQAEGKRDKSISDVNKEELEAMNRYLKEYGTFQQQKLAIAKEYAEKIRKAQSEGERLSLVKQRDAALQQVEVKAIKQSIDWGSVFGEFGAMFKDQLQPTIDKLKSIAQSDEFKSSSLQDQQTLYELISKLEQSNAAWDSDIFQKVSDDMTAYQTAMQNHLKAQERERLATEALALAKRDLAAAEQSGNGTDALNAQAKVTEAQLALNAAARDVQDFGTQVQETTSDLQASSTQAVNMFQNLESGLKGLTSGSLQGVGQGLMQLDKLFNKGGITKDVGNALASGFQSLLGKDSKAISEALGSAGMAGGIISGVLGILDLLKDGFSNIFVSLQDTVFGAVEGILNDVFSGDIIVKPLENSVKHVGTILDTITFGGFSNWLGSGDSDKNLERDIEYLTQSNQDLRNALDNLSDKMDKASVTESNDIYKVQKENLKKQEANTRESMQRSAAAYSNGFLGIGGSHSSNNKIDNGMSGSEWKKVSEIVGSSVKNAGQFFQLSSEQMAKLAEEDTTLYSKIKGLADDGYKNAAQFMDEYITYYRQLEELENAYNEKLTNTSFDSVRNDFKNALLDMESDAEDFANNFEKMMQNAIVESLMTKKYDKFLQEWYEEFAKAMEGDGKIDDDEQRKLQNRWNSITSQALAERDALKDAMGWEVSSDSSTSQSSTKGYSTTASQDSIDEANGRMTALQMSNEEIKNAMLSMLVYMNLISVSVSNNSITLVEIKNLMVTSNSHLEDIAGYTKKILDNFGTKLDSISKNIEKAI